MTLADYFIQKGFQIGIKQGLQLAAQRKGVQIGETILLKRMLKKGNSAEVVSKYTGISLRRIQAIEKELLEKASRTKETRPKDSGPLGGGG